MKYAFLLLFILFVNALTLAQSSIPSFNSAEERIVYNKNHNLDKYDGVLVEYAYEIICENVCSDVDLIGLASSFFEATVEIEIYEQDGDRFLSILTEGSVENHAASFDLRDLEFKKFEFYKRTYHLK